MTCHQSCTSIGTGKCTGNFALYCIRTCHGNLLMIFPVPVLLQESVQEIVPYTISEHVMETLNYPGKYRCQACVGNLTYPLHVLCKYWCRKCRFSSSVTGLRDKPQLKQTCQHLAVVYWQLVSLLMELSIDGENCSLTWCA